MSRCQNCHSDAMTGRIGCHWAMAGYHAGTFFQNSHWGSCRHSACDSCIHNLGDTKQDSNVTVHRNLTNGKNRAFFSTKHIAPATAVPRANTLRGCNETSLWRILNLAEPMAVYTILIICIITRENLMTSSKTQEVISAFPSMYASANDTFRKHKVTFLLPRIKFEYYTHKLHKHNLPLHFRPWRTRPNSI